MWDFIARFRSALFVGALVSFCGVLLYAQSRTPQSRGPLVGAVVDVAGIIERGMLWVTGSIDDVIHTYVMNVGAQEELTQLRREQMSVPRFRSQLREIEKENEELKKLAALATQLNGPRGLSARVIGRTGAPLARILRIDRGSDDGIRRGDGVLSAKGVIGQVAATGKRTSDVLLLSDPGAAIDALIQRTRAKGIVQGTGDSEIYASRVENFDRHADVREGDVLVTSGIGTRFPPGLLIGFVKDTEILEDNLYVRADVTPAASIDRVELVMVLRGRELKRRIRITDADEDEGTDAKAKEKSEGKAGLKGVTTKSESVP